MATEREQAVFGIWRRVNEIACSTENFTEIRHMIAEAGIEPGMHVGTDPAEFTPMMAGEWVRGQWADMIDAGSPFLNTARNISLHQYEKVTGLPNPEWTVGEGSTVYLDEIKAVVSGVAP